MTTLTATMSVGEIAAARPSAIRVFERHRIDYCCGGAATLEAACRNQSLQADALLAELAETPQTSDRDWSAAPLRELIEYIVGTHHAYLKEELPRLAGAAEKVRAKHGDRHPEVAEIASVFHRMREELDHHLMKEEMVLFPMVVNMEQGGCAPSHCGSVRNPIRVMTMEHDSAGEALAQLREISGGYQAPEDACITFRGLYYGLAELEQDLHRHIHLENNVLFPRAVELEAAVARS